MSDGGYYGLLRDYTRLLLECGVVTVEQATELEKRLDALKAVDAPVGSVVSLRQT